LVNTLKSTIFGARGENEIAICAAENLIAGGFVEDALDVLLITDNWELAVGKMMDLGMIIRAVTVCRLREPSKQRNKLLLKIVEKLADAGYFDQVVMVLAEIGDRETISGMFADENEFEQADLVMRL
jgi:hypothetical protein